MKDYHEGGNHNVRHDSTPEELEAFYDRDYFENNPRGYKNMTAAAKRSPWHDEVCGQFCNVWNVDGSRVLDAGCGTGPYARAFRDRGADVYAVELSHHAAAVAAEVLGEDKVIRGSMHNLERLKDGFFDLYFTAEAIEHVPYRYHLAMVREAFRVTKPGGIAYFQGQIQIKDYLDPDPRDDAGHIAVFPFGYWRDLLTYVGFELAEQNGHLERLEKALALQKRWKDYSWKFLFARKP